MTDHELAVKMVKQGLRVYAEIMSAEDIGIDLTKWPDFLAPHIAQVLMIGCINATVQVHMMKQLATALSQKDVKLP